MGTQQPLVGFCGPSYNLIDVQFDSQRTINYIPEVDEYQTGTNNFNVNLAAPNGKTLAYDPTGQAISGNAVRGGFTSPDGNTCLVVIDNIAYQMTGPTVPFTLIQVGTLLSSEGPVNFDAYDDVIIAVDGNFGYQYFQSTWTQITDPAFFGGTSVRQFDGLFVFNQPGTNKIYWSLPDLSVGITFDALDFDSKSGASDPIISFNIWGRQMYLVGTQHGEYWADNPSGNTQFQRIPGPYSEIGCAAAQTLQFCEYGAPFLSVTSRGGPMVHMFVGSNYATQRISTLAIEQYLARYQANLSAATAFIYQENGHILYQLNVPGMPSSLVYDLQQSNLIGVPLWHERTYTDNTNVDSRDQADNSWVFRGFVMFGDYSSQNIYYSDPTSNTNNGSPLNQIRITPHISNAMNRLYTESITITGRTGVGGQTPPPQLQYVFSTQYLQSEVVQGNVDAIGYIDPYFAALSDSVSIFTLPACGTGFTSDETFGTPFYQSLFAIWNNFTDTNGVLSFNVMIASPERITTNVFFQVGELLTSDAIIQQSYDPVAGMYLISWTWFSGIGNIPAFDAMSDPYVQTTFYG